MVISNNDLINLYLPLFYQGILNGHILCTSKDFQKPSLFCPYTENSSLEVKKYLVNKAIKKFTQRYKTHFKIMELNYQKLKKTLF